MTDNRASCKGKRTGEDPAMRHLYVEVSALKMSHIALVFFSP